MNDELCINTLTEILEECKAGNMMKARNPEFQNSASLIAASYIDSNKNLTEYEVIICDLILRISNIMYNETSDDILPLDDGLYDRLLEKYKKYNPNFQVGSSPVQSFTEKAQNEIVDEKVMCTYVSDEDADSKLFVRDLMKQNVPLSYGLRPKNLCLIVRDPITKRTINTRHKYPELVGTLDKCKCVLNAQAVELGVLNDDTFKIFERDFIHKCINDGVIHPAENFYMIGELKYDGISIEAEVKGDTIISALSRGDTADNIATDFTPILGGYKFPHAKDVDPEMKFGIKFEAVMLKRDMQHLSDIRGKSYKNCRNAIIGLFGASDAWKFVDYITLIPISSSINFDNRIDELKFLNTYYNSGEYNKYCVFYGNYQQILFQAKQFIESAEIIRPILRYMIDGVVFSLIDPKKIAMLGRENSVNKYQMAVKFMPKKVRTTFLGYTYNIGKSGDVIPMAHFKPCEFIGGIHSKQTIHSFQRYKELALITGQDIDIEYRNDVITYITKPNTEHNRELQMQYAPDPFIQVCPYCGGLITVSPTGKTAKCTNPYCPERAVYRMTNMIDHLGFEGFSEEAVRALEIKSFIDLINITKDKTDILGPNESNRFMKSIDELLIKGTITDYKLMSAFAFEGMADEKWKKILVVFTIDELIRMQQEILFANLNKINGIGPKICESIVKGFYIYKDELCSALYNIGTIINSKGSKKKPKIVISGFRDDYLCNILNSNGFEASYNAVTKDTIALIVKNPNENSTKIQKAKANNIPIMTRDEFIVKNNIILQ